MLALNALGWAAHVDVSLDADRDQPAHTHVTAYSASSDSNAVDIDPMLAASDHCGHAHASDIVVLGLAGHVVPVADCVPSLDTPPDYESLALQPPLGPPIV